METHAPWNDEQLLGLLFLSAASRRRGAETRFRDLRAHYQLDGAYAEDCDRNCVPDYADIARLMFIMTNCTPSPPSASRRRPGSISDEQGSRRLTGAPAASVSRARNFRAPSRLQRCGPVRPPPKTP